MTRFAVLGHQAQAEQIQVNARGDLGIEVRYHAITTREEAESDAAFIETRYDVVVIAANSDKEAIVEAALPFINGIPQLIVAGYAHFEFKDETYHDLVDALPVPSLANGYPNSRIHLYQCLEHAARQGLKGDIAEFGIFKGGTTLFLAQAAHRLGLASHVYGFDTFAGFPPRRSALDMYDHEGCVHVDIEETCDVLRDYPVTVVPGDIVETANHVGGRDLILSFIDTDNYTSAAAAIEVVTEATVVGGAIVFDHYTGVDRFRYTLGERMAAKAVRDDPRFFHLHGTGVFLKVAP